MLVKTAIGQDSHVFDPSDQKKPLILGGVVFDAEPPLKGNSDADVVLHALTNAISGITGRNILGAISDRMCLKEGITDSKEYLKLALQDLAPWQLSHLSFSMECARPHIEPKLKAMRERIASLLSLRPENIGLTATSGEGLTACGRGKGIQVTCIVTVTGTE